MIKEISSSIRVRFAPSPTGYLHLGGARTALFNWLFARQNKGSFVLRIEDTDKERSSAQYEQDITESLKWLGLDWDEGPDKDGKYGPYRQSLRTEFYLNYARKLISEGKAYYCYCSQFELDEMRKASELKKQPFRYNRKCIELAEDEMERYKKEGRKPSIRLKISQEGVTNFNDLIRGKIEFKNELLDDFIIVRSDGSPTYNFVVVIDDALMKISHVIRGEDHISNTPKQIFIYKSLDFILPEFAHIPLIFGADKTRLSKRHAATSVAEYKNRGYLPETMVNFLSLLGWAYNDKEQIFSRDELTEKFSLKNISKNPAAFNLEKLDWLNGLYIRKLDIDTLVAYCIPYYKNSGYDISSLKPEKFKKIVSLEQERLKKIEDIVPYTDFFFKKEIVYEPDAIEKAFKDKSIVSLLSEWIKILDKTALFKAAELEMLARGLAEKSNLKFSALVHPTRVALTGRLVSPGLFEVMEILGRDICLSRLKYAIEKFL